MPDETTEQVIEPNVEETQEPTTPTLEDVLKQNEALMKSIETQKKEIAGINKTNTAFKTQYDDLLKSTETDKQTAERLANEKKLEYEKEQSDFLTSKAEFSKKENEFNVRVKALELGFTAEDITQLNFGSIEQVESTRAYLDAKITATKEDTAKNIIDAHKGKPEGGYNNKNNSVDTSFLNDCRA
ncbi:MAG: hypothetical protein GY777_03365 [Candidatus Brocadiaceae bacterium]|nr:hypothetical protein [Candidatus Brocadiaceae bacterium]